MPRLGRLSRGQDPQGRARRQLGPWCQQIKPRTRAMPEGSWARAGAELYLQPRGPYVTKPRQGAYGPGLDLTAEFQLGCIPFFSMGESYASHKQKV